MSVLAQSPSDRLSITKFVRFALFTQADDKRNGNREPVGTRAITITIIMNITKATSAIGDSDGLASLFLQTYVLERN